MTDIFSKEQNRNFTRLTEIESFLQTNTVRNLSVGEYFSLDLHKAYNLLAVHNGHWSTYCNNVLGLGITISAERDGTEIGSIYYDDDNFVALDYQNVYVLSRDQETRTKAVRVGDSDYAMIDLGAVGFINDNGFYVYTIPNNGTYSANVGYSAISGYYPDEWIETESEFSVVTGDEGVVMGRFYYPGTNFANKKIEVYFEDELVQTISIDSDNTEFVINLGADQAGTLRFSCNFEYDEKGLDEPRPLAIVITELQVK